MGWQRIERLRNLRLPAHLRLAKDLSSGLQIFAAIKEHGTHDELVAHDGLVVVDMGSAVGAVVAVDRLACRWKGKAVSQMQVRVVGDVRVHEG